uniref:Uncharacterized protein n=1 Tax=Tetranychus urticae TaxID=32264 RepID=T1KTD6_TETUR
MSVKFSVKNSSVMTSCCSFPLVFFCFAPAQGKRFKNTDQYDICDDDEAEDESQDDKETRERREGKKKRNDNDDNSHDEKRCKD